MGIASIAELKARGVVAITGSDRTMHPNKLRNSGSDAPA
jgi:hypothetical protein